MVVSISACLFSTATGWETAEPTSSAPAASEEMNFILRDWVEVEERVMVFDGRCMSVIEMQARRNCDWHCARECRMRACHGL